MNAPFSSNVPNSGTSRRIVQGVATFGWFLRLNPMTGNTENGVDFGPFPTKEAALAFMDAERVEPYEDEGPDLFMDSASGKKTYHKSFRKGGPLEWCNPEIRVGDRDIEHLSPWGHGLRRVILGFEVQYELGDAP